MDKLFTFTAAAVFSISVHAGDIFDQSKPHMGGGAVSKTPVVKEQASASVDSCADLVRERRSIEYIDQKQIWVPIEQQNANYHRMNWLKSQMAARRCSY